MPKDVKRVGISTGTQTLSINISGWELTVEINVMFVVLSLISN